MAGALHVFTRPEAEVEANGDQVSDVGGLVSEEVAASATMECTIPRGVAFFHRKGGLRACRS